MTKAISEIKNLRERKNLVPVLYILSLIPVFPYRYGDYIIKPLPLWTTGAIWIVIAFVQLWMDIKRKRTCGLSDLKWLLKLYFLPHVLIHLYTVFLMVIGKVSWSDLTSNVSVYIPCLLAIGSLYLFKERAFKYISIALICSWILSVLVSLITKGFQIIPHAIIQGYIDPFYKVPGLRGNYFELHDFISAAGYIIVFYIFSQKQFTKKDFFVVSTVLLLMILGIKRISIVGLILATLFHLIIRWFPEKKQYSLCLIAGWAGFFFCYLFVYWMSVPDAFFDFAKDFGINTMGRNYYYQAMMKYAEFSPFFMGIGRHVTVRILTTDLAYYKIGQVHSDLVKMYVENGFIVFGLWLWYYLINLARQYKKRFGLREAIFCFGCIVYTFTIHIADYNEISFTCQLFSIITPAAYALSRRKAEEGVRGEE